MEGMAVTRRLVLLGLVLSLVAGACGDDDARPIFSSTTSVPPTTSSATEAVVDTTSTTVGAASTSTTEQEFTSITDIETITQLTIFDLEEWWGSELPAVFGVAYDPVSEFGPYFISQGDIPFCGGPLKREEFEANAFYCSIDDTVQWDAETLMAPLFQEFGDFTVALVLAHEWGHAVQARFGFDHVNQSTIVSELQADCLAGAWTRRIEAGESNLLRLEPGDSKKPWPVSCSSVTSSDRRRADPTPMGARSIASTPSSMA